MDVDRSEGDREEAGFTRRDFLRAAGMAAAAGVAASALGAPPKPAEGGPAKGKDEEFNLEDGDDAHTGMIYRAIPACKIRISTVVSGPAGDEVQRRMVQHGVNYFHKVDACGSREFRQKLNWDFFYCDCCIDTTGKREAMEEFENRRSGAGLDVIHFFKIHGTLGNPDDVQHDQPIFDAFRTLRDQGKTKWLAISLHSGPDMFEACVDSGLFQMIQICFNPAGSSQRILDILAKAKEAGIAVIAMKSVMGGPAKWQDDPKAREALHDFWPEGTSAAQAILRWDLAQPGVTAVVPDCGNTDVVDENCAGGGAKLQAWEREGVERLAAALSPTWCRSCRTCEAGCPRSVQIPDILRYRMYARHYGKPEGARQLYAALEPSRRAAACSDCGACERACPHGLAVREMLRDAERALA